MKDLNISVSQLPGIGQKITMKTSEDDMLVIIVHHTGKRELYFFDDGDSEEADFAMDLTPEETRELAAQLLGATYQPVDIEKIRMFKRQIIVDYIKVKAKSSLVDKTIEESDVRNKTGATIIGIVHGEDMVAIPESDTTIKPGDVLMSIGKEEQISSLSKLCQGEE
ncbi:cation:proton antiporter regulatory subunit [Virgibacillus necropolis]|uniref:cation:proton antiporter regulatory subunit n=1 Tax=Virgibacillus necropolis TaxID=163877 RepID=UPI001D058A23|nr:TrkA C-terminal domain-containing protein [Virgibacillus necropolis]